MNLPIQQNPILSFTAKYTNRVLQLRTGIHVQPTFNSNGVEAAINPPPEIWDAIWDTGANALVEFHALNKPMLLIPLPLGASRGDQIQNAKSYEERGMALLLEQENLSKDTLIQKLDELIEKKDSLVEALKNSPLSNGTEKVLSLIYELAGE